MDGRSKSKGSVGIASIIGILTFLFAASVPRQGAVAATLDQVIQGAKKEGVIRGQWGQTTAGGSQGFAEFLAGVNKKYGLNLKGQFTPGPDMQRIMLRIIQEEAAGQPASTDVYLGNSQAMLDGSKAKVLVPMEWAKIIDRPLPSGGPGYPIMPGGLGVAYGTPVVGIEYNSKLVKGDDIPRRLEDLLKPKWKGKIASTPYAAGLREFAMPDLLGREYMVDFTKKLSKQIGGLLRCGESERITSGEFVMLALTCGGNDVVTMEKMGAPIGHATVAEGTILHSRYVAVPKNSRAPNAGALFAAYLFTPEGQALMWKHDGMDLYLFPEANMKKEVDKVRAVGGKVVVNSPQWLDSLKGYAEMQKELEKILREGR
ncbi:MAG: ABC transporter substrate-binding protein [Deltaproteobacteria bacterium]|nr:ABC transporter substrate-binding protein [Deltaproteobacteria bacterium]